MRAIDPPSFLSSAVATAWTGHCGPLPVSGVAYSRTPCCSRDMPVVFPALIPPEVMKSTSSKLVNLYEAVRLNPGNNKLEIGEFLFAEYTCGIGTDKLALWAHTDY